MAKVVGPLYSVSASGTIADAFTFGSWKGIQWVRTWFKPFNPKTPKQVNIRTAMALIVAYWHTQTQVSKDLWNAYVAGKKYTGMNYFVSRAAKAYIAQLTIDVTPVSVIHVDSPPDDVWTWT